MEEQNVIYKTQVLSIGAASGALGFHGSCVMRAITARRDGPAGPDHQPDRCSADCAINAAEHASAIDHYSAVITGYAAQHPTTVDESQFTRKPAAVDDI